MPAQALGVGLVLSIAMYFSNKELYSTYTPIPSTAMANPKHLAILQKGVVVWNEWRRERPDLSPDLCGANLGHARLAEVDLGGAKLASALFHIAKAQGADLRGSATVGADFWGANLDRADLCQADLRGASFDTAKLERATLPVVPKKSSALIFLLFSTW